MAITLFKKITLLTVSTVLMLAGLQGCGQSTDSEDSAITQAVVSKLKADGQIPDEMISVETKKGKVTLTGSVETTDEEKRLVGIAQAVQGVKSVESHLVVKETSSVKEQIPVPTPQAAPQVDQDAKKPETQPTAASTPSTDEAQEAAQPQQEKDKASASQTDMQSSSSSIVTQPPSNIEDVAITARVKSLLMADPAYQNVVIETQSGVVSLSGNVNAQPDADAMVKKVEAIEGVKKVDSKVTVKPKDGQ